RGGRDLPTGNLEYLLHWHFEQLGEMSTLYWIGHFPSCYPVFDHPIKQVELESKTHWRELEFDHLVQKPILKYRVFRTLGHRGTSLLPRLARD
ncbi:MAG TPA: hypothetical protein VKX96_04760, partial [Chloroflexota bacterium]|nr:hypothetical protein [Chloroflexota bacterium]